MLLNQPEEIGRVRDGRYNAPGKDFYSGKMQQQLSSGSIEKVNIRRVRSCHGKLRAESIVCFTFSSAFRGFTPVKAEDPGSNPGRSISKSQPLLDGLWRSTGLELCLALLTARFGTLSPKEKKPLIA